MRRMGLLGSIVGILGLLMVTVLLAMQSSPQSGERYAVLIGIEKYPNLVQRPDLKVNLPGPRNDVEKMRELLVNRFGFKPQNIRVLLDAEKPDIEDAIRNWLRRRLHVGDVALIHFSGHGTRIPDQNGDEPDRKDEALVCNNFHPAVTKLEHLILDDELAQWLRDLQRRGAHVTMIVDACHSGTVYRAIACVSRYVEPSTSLVQELGGWQEEGEERFLFRGATADDNAPVWMISAARDDQTAVSARFPKVGWMGALTYHLVNYLAGSEQLPTYAQLIDHLRRTVQVRFWQEPQASGPNLLATWLNVQIGAPIAVAQQPEPPKPPEQPSKPQEPTKPTEQPSKPQEPSKPQVKPPVPSQPSVIAPSPVTSPLVSPPSPIPPAAPIIAVLPSDSLRVEKVCVFVQDFGEKAKVVQESLNRLGYVQVVSSVDSADRILIRQPKAPFAANLTLRDGFIEEQISANTVAELIQQLRPSLVKAYVLKRLTTLHQPDTSLAPILEIVNEGQRAFRVRPNAYNPVGHVVKIGTRTVFRFKAAQDCYLTLIDLPVYGPLTVLFPNAYHQDNFVRGGQWVTIPSPDMPFEIVADRPTGRSIVIAIASRTPLDLNLLNLTMLSQEVIFASARDIEAGVELFLRDREQAILPAKGFAVAYVVAEVVE